MADERSVLDRLRALEQQRANIASLLQGLAPPPPGAGADTDAVMEVPDENTRPRDVPSGCLRRRVYVLELFSGNGTVGAIASTLLGECPVVTVDWSDTYGVPTIRATLPRDTELVIQTCRKMFPGMRPVMWASPDCSQYSIAKTRGARDLVTADANVTPIHEIATALGALVVIIENPATGLLVGRDVISFMPFKTEVHYCKYGRLYPKPTMLWCTHDLREHGFTPRVCNRDCDASYVRNGVRRHVRSLTDYGLGVRISVPDALVASVFKTVSTLVRALLPAVPAFDPSEPRAARADDVGVVDLILACRVASDESVELLVEWVGHDHAEWICAGNLDADVGTYDFEDEDVRDECMKLLRG